MTLRSGGALHPRSLSFSPPVSPVGATENLVSSASPRRRGRPPSSPSNSTSGPSPPQAALRSPSARSVRLSQPPFKTTPPDVAGAAGVPSRRISAMDATSSAQELISDADVAVASVLNAKLEFDEALLNENVALHCDAQGGEDDAEEASNVQMDVDSVDEDTKRYLNFSRTVVVCEAAKDSSQVRPNSGSISQLDGADNDSESDTGEANAEGDTQEVGNSFRDSEPLKCPNRQLVCTISSVENQSAGDSIDQIVESEICEEQEVTSLQENLIVVSSQHEASATRGLEDQESSLIHLVTAGEEVLLDSESTKDSKEVFLDDTSGNFISADGSILDVKGKPAVPGEVSNSSSLNKIKVVLNKTSPPAVPTSSGRNIVIVKPTTTMARRYVTVQPRTQVLKTIKMAVPPNSVPVFSPSPPVSGTLLASSPVINGFGQPPKSRTIAIRIATPKQVAEQSAQQCLPASPQVLLVNRAGQILVKNQQTNTFQIQSANSPSYAHISQIAKIIHSGNIIQRPVPKVTVIPVPQDTLAKSALARIVSYSGGNGAAQSTQVLIRSLPQHYAGSQLQSSSQPTERTERVGSGGQKEMAQAIIDKAMASHRETASLLNPSQLQVSPYLNERLLPESSQRLRSPPNILASSKPQVKVKRVSSATDRIGVKKCRTDFMDHAAPSSQEDLNRQDQSFVKFKKRVII